MNRWCLVVVIHPDVTPDFSRLLGELRSNADEGDAQEALDRTETNYHRLIGYADGNPGVALTAWSGCATSTMRCVLVQFVATLAKASEVLP